MRDPARISTEKLLYSFSSEKHLSRWTLFTDQAFGGSSKASLTMAADQVNMCSAVLHLLSHRVCRCKCQQ